MGKKLGYNVLQRDLLFALLQGLQRVHMQTIGLAVSCNDLILILAYEREGGDDGLGRAHRQ